jgi:hypothetical protein
VQNAGHVCKQAKSCDGGGRTFRSKLEMDSWARVPSARDDIVNGNKEAMATEKNDEVVADLANTMSGRASKRTLMHTSRRSPNTSTKRRMGRDWAKSKEAGTL